MNGTWRVTDDIKTPTIGKPASLRYKLKDGQGTVRLTHGEGVTCRAKVTAGLMQSGNLIINSRVKARCSDGSRYQMPEIVFSQGANGPLLRLILNEENGKYLLPVPLGSVPKVVRPEFSFSLGQSLLLLSNVWLPTHVYALQPTAYLYWWPG